MPPKGPEGTRFCLPVRKPPIEGRYPMEPLPPQPKPFHVSPHLFAILAAETPQHLFLAINRMVRELGIEGIRSGETWQQVANRVRAHHQIAADQIERCQYQLDARIA